MVNGDSVSSVDGVSIDVVVRTVPSNKYDSSRAF